MALLLLLAGCGGGGSTATGSSGNSQGGGSTQGGDNSQGSGEASLLAQYQGKKVEAVLDESSVGPFLDAVLNTDPLFGSNMAMTGRKAGSRVTALQGAVVKSSLDCESGSGTVSGELDEATGRGTLTVVYNKCLQDGETATGTQLIRYDRWNLLEEEPLDYLVTFNGLTLVSSQGSQQLIGTVQRTADNPCSETLTYDLLVNASDPSQSGFADHLVVSDVCQQNSPGHLARSIQGQFYAGTSGRASLSSQGLEVANVDMGTGDFSMQPMAGSVTIKSGNSQVTLASWLESNSDGGSYRHARSRLSFDHNGDGAVENRVALPSRYLLGAETQDYRDSDQDGMFDGWERKYGTDPDVADASGDINHDTTSNFQEFWAGILQQNGGVYMGSGVSVDPQRISGIQDESLDMPLTLQGRVYRYEVEYASRIDLVLDVSAIADWDLSVNGAACQLEAKNTRLRCPDIELGQFVGEDKKLSLGSLHMTPKSGSITVALPVSWENSFPRITDSNSYPTIQVISSAAAYAVRSINRGYVLSELDNELSHTLYFANTGGYMGMSPNTVTITGEWPAQTESLSLSSVDKNNGDWVCKVASTQFSCTSVGKGIMMPLTLHFAKPTTSGKTVIQYQVNTDYGFIVRQESATGTLAYGDTSELQQQLTEAEAAGKSEFVIPKGTYVGRLLNDPAHPLTLKAEAGAELWLATNDRMDPRTFLQANVIDGLTIHAEKPLKATEAIRNSHIDLLPADFDWVMVDAPLIEANQISVTGYDTRCFSLSHDVLLRNNRVLAGSGDTPILFSGSIYDTRPKLTLVNNTLSNIHSLTDSSNSEDGSDWVLINNLFINPPRSTNVLTPLFGYVDSYTLSHNLLPAAYQSLGGTNLYTDTPGVDAANGYGLNANSPALDAGDSSAESGATDLYGNPRLVGASIDIGAAERQ